MVVFLIKLNRCAYVSSFRSIDGGAHVVDKVASEKKDVPCSGDCRLRRTD